MRLSEEQSTRTAVTSFPRVATASGRRSSARADAVDAALDAQRGLAAEPWSEAAVLRVRMGLHTGETQERDGDYFGLPVNRAARVMGAGNGGQIVASSVTAALIGRMPGIELVDLGELMLKGLREATHVFGVAGSAYGWIDRPLASAPAGNLPVPLTDFVGDLEKIAEQVGQLVQRRLVTLTGPGGVGKTRTATELAWRNVDDFRGGAWFVDLAAVSEPDGVIPAIATTMSLRLDAGGAPLDALVDWIRGRKLLLLVDNCEHLLSTVSRVVQRLIEASPTLTVLATSREPLGVRGERIHSVSTLEPDAEAVELFVDRARAADDTFALNATDREVVAAICGRLDGIPLAVELAAARIRSTTPAELLARLDDRLRLLRRGDRTAPDRHQTLQATIAWSYQLLSDDERLLFDRLAVFAPGFDRAATEAVCAGDEFDPFDIDDHLGALVDKSMLVADRSSSRTRYRLLETLREFASARLAERGSDATDLQARHAQHYLNVARATRERTFGPDQEAASLDIGAAWPNIGIAVMSSLASGAVTTSDEFIAATVYLAIRLAKLDHREWVQRTIIAGEERSIETPLAHGAAANWAWIEGDPARTLRHAAISLASPDARSEAPDMLYVDTWICCGLAEIATHGARCPDTDAQLRALATSPATIVRAETLRTLAETAVVQILRSPSRTSTPSLPRLRNWRCRPSSPKSPTTAGLLAYLTPSPDLLYVRACFAENLRIAYSIGDRDNLAVTGSMQGAVSLELGDPDVASEIRAALEFAYEDRHWNTLEQGAGCARRAPRATGQTEMAATLVGYLDTHGHHAWHTPLEEARAVITDEATKQSRALGAAMDGPAAVDLALRTLDSLTS